MRYDYLDNFWVENSRSLRLGEKWDVVDVFLYCMANLACLNIIKFTPEKAKILFKNRG